MGSTWCHELKQDCVYDGTTIYNTIQRTDLDDATACASGIPIPLNGRCSTRLRCPCCPCAVEMPTSKQRGWIPHSPPMTVCRSTFVRCVGTAASAVHSKNVCRSVVPTIQCLIGDSAVPRDIAACRHRNRVNGHRARMTGASPAVFVSDKSPRVVYRTRTCFGRFAK